MAIVRKSTLTLSFKLGYNRNFTVRFEMVCNRRKVIILYCYCIVLQLYCNCIVLLL